MKDGPKKMDDKSFVEKELEKKVFLIDTNTLSEPLRPKPNEKVLAKIKRHRSKIATAAQVLF